MIFALQNKIDIKMLTKYIKTISNISKGHVKHKMIVL